MMPVMTLSDSAQDYLQKAIAEKNALGFRLSIKKTGCSGFAYAPSLVLSINTTDRLIETVHGIQLYMDTQWQHILEGTMVDYIEENKSGLKQKKLIFTNPNESSRCGCGESFHVEQGDDRV